MAGRRAHLWMKITRQTSRVFFAAGNVLHVHDLVDFVSLEAEALAAGVEEYLNCEGASAL